MLIKYKNNVDDSGSTARCKRSQIINLYKHVLLQTLVLNCKQSDGPIKNKGCVVEFNVLRDFISDQRNVACLLMESTYIASQHRIRKKNIYAVLCSAYVSGFFLVPPVLQTL